MRWEGCTIETLEDRRMLSASTVKHGMPIPIAMPAAQRAVRVTKKTAAKKPSKRVVHTSTSTTPTPVAWNDLVGTWTGTFSNDELKQDVAGTISATFQPRWIASNTGTFNLSAMAGQSSALTTITPDHAGNVLAYIPLKNGGAVCLTAGLSFSGKLIIGRWCSIIGTKYTTGTFTLSR